MNRDDRWLYSKDHIIYILMLFGDRKCIFQATKEMAELWEGTEFLQYRLIEAVYKLKISGFRKEAEQIKKIAESSGDKQMSNFATRYLANEHKYKSV